MFCIDLISFSSSASFVFFSNKGYKIDTLMQINTRQAGIIKRLIKYVATLKATSKTVRYIRFFIEIILTETNKKSRGEITWV